MSIEENNRLGDLLKYEADKNYCREVVTIAEGQNLKMGSVIGIVTESDKAKMVSVSAGDGSDTAFGVLLEDVDATSGDKKAVVVARDAIVAKTGLVFPEEASAEDQKKAILKSLEARGIVARATA